MDLVLAFSMGVVAANQAETRKYVVGILPQAIPLALTAYKTLAEKCKRQNTIPQNDLELPVMKVIQLPVIKRPKLPQSPTLPEETISPTLPESEILSVSEPLVAEAVVPKRLFGPDWTSESSAVKDLPPAIVSELSLNEEAVQEKPECSNAIALDLLVSNRKDNHEHSLAEDVLLEREFCETPEQN